MNYDEFIKTKQMDHIDAGFEPTGWVPAEIKDFQRDIVSWACRRGRAAIFADTGLGKTLMQLTWAHLVAYHTDKPVLVLEERNFLNLCPWSSY